MESFPWTRVGGVDEPEAHKQPVDMSRRDRISPEEVRSLLRDGSFGGHYRQPEEVEARIWEIGVRETRDLLERGWR
jgi:creatinine amidohydrolase